MESREGVHVVIELLVRPFLSGCARVRSVEVVRYGEVIAPRKNLTHQLENVNSCGEAMSHMSIRHPRKLLQVVFLAGVYIS